MPKCLASFDQLNTCSKHWLQWSLDKLCVLGRESVHRMCIACAPKISNHFERQMGSMCFVCLLLYLFIENYRRQQIYALMYSSIFYARIEISHCQSFITAGIRIFHKHTRFTAYFSKIFWREYSQHTTSTYIFKLRWIPCHRLHKWSISIEILLLLLNLNKYSSFKQKCNH